MSEDGSMRPTGLLGAHRFSVLLAALILLLLAAPLVHGTGLAAFVVTLVFAVMLLAAVLAVITSRRSFVVAAICVAPAIVLQLIGLVAEGTAHEILKAGFGIVALVFVTAVLLVHLFRARRVTHDTIAASLCVYVLLGVIWALAYTLIAARQPDAFSFSFGDPGDPGDTLEFGGERTVMALYYSFVTLTTLGYGDVTPATAAARMLSAVEAIVGQFYIAVLVARLVGLHIVHASSRES